ncbi:MAG: class I SAM-dependent methyltransferase [Oligoflexales bacterium]
MEVKGAFISNYDFVSSPSRLLRAAIHKKLDDLNEGCLELIDEFGEHEINAGISQLHARVTVNSNRFYRMLAFGGALGAGESYINGDWDTPDLVSLFRILLRNRSILENFESGFSIVQKGIEGLKHLRRRNTVLGSRKNIEAHYDLSNEMFELWLDKSLMYSCAFYEKPDDDLDKASINKMERICRKLQLKATDEVMEIGTGWGGLAIYMAENYGCNVTTTTVSKQQYEYVKAKLKSCNLCHKVTVLKSDYRKLTGNFDKLVSVEMIEAVGADYLNEYIETCSRLLKKNGLFLLQAITIQDQLFDEAVKEIDFIKRFIFPGSFIPSIHAIISACKTSSDLKLLNMEDIGLHYARTLEDWRKRFHRNKQEIRKLGFDEHFFRMWDYYFCYCIGGFLERSIGNAHMLFAKPDYRGDLSPFSTWQWEANYANRN